MAIVGADIAEVSPEDRLLNYLFGLVSLNSQFGPPVLLILKVEQLKEEYH